MQVSKAYQANKHALQYSQRFSLKTELCNMLPTTMTKLSHYAGNSPSGIASL